MVTTDMRWDSGPRTDLIRLLLLLALALASVCFSLALASDEPVIGVLLQETSGERTAHGKYFVPASYARFVQQSGARALPVFVGQPDDYYEDLMRNINGVLFPGGSADLLESLYARAAKVIYRVALQMNDAGEYFVLWGTCLGHQEMSTLPTGKNLLVPCERTFNEASNMDLLGDLAESRMLSALPKEVLQILAAEPVAFHIHRYCLSVATYNRTEELSDFFRIVGTNVDAAEMQFVSAMEARRYPFYSVQFHPEKNNYDWLDTHAVNHSTDAVLISQALSNFLVNKARKGPQRLSNGTYLKQLFDWYPLTFDGSEADYYFS